MCGRYANHVSEMRGWARILQDWPTDIALAWNVSPTQTVPAFTDTQGTGMRWGLVPHWARDTAPKYATFNARIETIADKPAFRNAWGKSRRCLIPALGYYEWCTEGKSKQPYFIRPIDGEPMVFGGIWELWKSEDEELLSCSILTMPASRYLSSIHDRMPVLLAAHQADQWLHGTTEDAIRIIDQARRPDVEFYPVSTAVNNPRNNDRRLLDPINRS